MKIELLCFVIACTLGTGDCWSDNRRRKFKDDFLFGVASSSYQVEGAWDADGKGESIWDRLVHENPDKIEDKTTGDVAADSYHHYERDVEMLRELGVDFYRFSISWPRLLPNGYPFIRNDAGFEYYDKLIDELLKYDIEPVITLYHWDLPQHLHELGGWISPKSSDWFHDYAAVVFQRYSHKVKYWITINQPTTVCFAGYGSGILASSTNTGGGEEYTCIKNMLLAHAKTWHLYNRAYKSESKGEVGITLSINWFDPISNKTEHFEKAEQTRQYSIGLIANPIFSKEGGFPDEIKKIIDRKSKEEGLESSRLPQFTEKEIKLIRGSSDFLGVNHYTTSLVEDASDEAGTSLMAKDLNIHLSSGKNWKSSVAPWLKSAPYGLYKSFLWLNEKYDYPKMLITENGWATETGLEDHDRVQYMRGNLDALLFAIEDGTRVIGYTYWSLMDNFEWIFGYKHRYGLYEVDFNDAERPRKARLSALVYKQIIKSRIVDDEWKPKSMNISISKRKTKKAKDEL